jgi:hypothetical protein
MDRSWARQRLEDFLALCHAYDQHERSTGYTFDAKAAELNSQINGDIPTIREIVKRLNPELVEEIDAPNSMYGMTATSSAIERALGILRDEEELKARLAPDAPSLIADGFHPRAGHAFISYVREDSHEVDRLQAALEAAGVSVWRDRSNLWPGEDWRVKIRRAITENALVFIACFSSRSVVRVTSYQNEELVLAIEQLRLRPADYPWFIPVRFDNCEIPGRDVGAGRTFNSFQRADLFGDRREREMERLVTAVARLLDQPHEEVGVEEETGRLISFEPHTFSAVITQDQFRLVLPLVFQNTGVAPIIIQNLRMRFADEVDAASLDWVTTRRAVTPRTGDWEFPAVFPVAGGTACQIFAEFKAASLGFALKARDYRVAVEAKLGHKEDWDTILQFTLHVGRIVDPEYYITYENTPDGLSEEEREDVQIGIDFAQLGPGKMVGSSADLPTVNEPDSGS